MADIGKAFGDFVKARRKEIGKSQRQLAEEVGVAQAYMSMVENGKKGWPQKYVSAIAEALDVSETTLARAAGVISEESITPDDFDQMLDDPDPQKRIAAAISIMIARSLDDSQRAGLDIGRMQLGDSTIDDLLTRLQERINFSVEINDPGSDGSVTVAVTVDKLDDETAELIRSLPRRSDAPDPT